MANTVIGNKIWSMACVLRDEGVDAREYLEQITYLLFLKMADEYSRPPFLRNLGLPTGCDWETLKSKSGAELGSTYKTILETLSGQKGMLGEIYGGARTAIEKPAILARVIGMIDSEKWTALSQDVKGDIYEDLLAKTTSDGGAGAGQYFTPRALINSIVACVQPKPDCAVSDPCCGSGGFLLAAKTFIENNFMLDRNQKEKLKFRTFTGGEIDRKVYKTCLMNLFLHGISDLDRVPPIVRKDSLLTEPSDSDKVEYVLTNPPFGTKSNYTFTNEQGEQEQEDTTYNRQDFWATSSNKQLNFLQHINSMLKIGGTAAVVLPDNVLDSQGAGEMVRRKLLMAADLHTILRLPTGIFYAQGVKANVLFFEKKSASPSNQTKEVWIYDLRSDTHFTLKKNPLKESDLADFIACYNPKNRHERDETYDAETNPNGRWRRFTYDEIIGRDNASLDIKWIENKSNLTEVTLAELVEQIKEKSVNIANAALALEKLISGIEE
ncbi:MAG: type I restriction-modification system subunit M [Christensenellaceae bacterium]|jgi:type I restriction enzyme M protein|nr:type I restriction-modification system subunit M [Christensenellaceae bacterium]